MKTQNPVPPLQMGQISRNGTQDAFRGLGGSTERRTHSNESAMLDAIISNFVTLLNPARGGCPAIVALEHPDDKKEGRVLPAPKRFVPVVLTANFRLTRLVMVIRYPKNHPNGEGGLSEAIKDIMRIQSLVVTDIRKVSPIDHSGVNGLMISHSAGPICLLLQTSEAAKVLLLGLNILSVGPRIDAGVHFQRLTKQFLSTRESLNIDQLTPRGAEQSLGAYRSPQYIYDIKTPRSTQQEGEFQSGGLKRRLSVQPPETPNWVRSTSPLKMNSHSSKFNDSCALQSPRYLQHRSDEVTRREVDLQPKRLLSNVERTKTRGEKEDASKATNAGGPRNVFTRLFKTCGVCCGGDSVVTTAGPWEESEQESEEDEILPHTLWKDQLTARNPMSSPLRGSSKPALGIQPLPLIKDDSGEASVSSNSATDSNIFCYSDSSPCDESESVVDTQPIDTSKVVASKPVTSGLYQLAAKQPTEPEVPRVLAPAPAPVHYDAYVNLPTRIGSQQEFIMPKTRLFNKTQTMLEASDIETVRPTPRDRISTFDRFNVRAESDSGDSFMSSADWGNDDPDLDPAVNKNRRSSLLSLSSSNNKFQATPFLLAARRDTLLSDGKPLRMASGNQTMGEVTRKQRRTNSTAASH